MAAPTTPTVVVVVGAGVIGLTTAMEILRQQPTTSITVAAKHLPGDQSSSEYCSSWAGANWMSYEDNNNNNNKWSAQTGYEQVALRRLLAISAAASGNSGVKRFPLRLVYDDEDIKTHGYTHLRAPWFEDLAGGVTEVNKGDLPGWSSFGLDPTTFMINPGVYLAWLQSRLLEAGVRFVQRSYEHIDQVFDDFSNAVAVFNCTGLGARKLGGIEDTKVYPIKQVGKGADALKERDDTANGLSITMEPEGRDIKLRGMDSSHRMTSVSRNR